MILALLFSIAFAKDVPVTVKWEHKNIPPGMKIYDLKSGSKAALWKTDTVKSLKEAPVGNEIPTGEMKLATGSKKRFVLVYENKSDQALYFFAAPHQAEPAESSLGFKFKCLCINHAFKIQPNEIWYRVVEIRIAPKFLGDRLTLTHQVIGLDPAKAEDFNKSMGPAGHHHEDT